MFAEKVDWTVQSLDTIQGTVKLRSSSGNQTEVAFERIYAEILDLSDEQGSESGAFNDELDSFTGVQGWLPSCDSTNVGGLNAATNIDLGVDEHHVAGPGRDAGPSPSYLGVPYPGSAMERLTSQTSTARFGSGPAFGATIETSVAASAQRADNSIQSIATRGDLAPRSNSAGTLNKTQLSTWMDAHALARSSHHCAMYCRLGLEAGGISTEDRPRSGDAGDYGPFLLRHGAQTVLQDSYVPRTGDVAVFDKTDQHPHGHIEMYDGHHWVSDFMQHSFSPYHDASSTPAFTIYRLA